MSPRGDSESASRRRRARAAARSNPKSKPKPKSKAKSPPQHKPYKVLWHPKAVQERDKQVKDATEQVAIVNAREKLEASGPGLQFPHQSSVQGKHGKALRELRPRSGKSPWRPLYARLTNDTFVILTIAPEAKVDPAGFDNGAKRAQTRLKDIKDD